MIWLYDNHTTHPDVIPFHMLQRMHVAQMTDSSRRTASGRKSKSRKSLRAVCRNMLRSITPEDPSSRPVNLDLLTFKIFARFLSTFKKSVYKCMRRVYLKVIKYERRKRRRSSSVSDKIVCVICYMLYTYILIHNI